MHSVTVKFKNSSYNYTTSVSKQTTEEAAKDYFVGTSFDVGSYPIENIQTCISIDYVKNDKN